jgi:hypothetical protein
VLPCERAPKTEQNHIAIGIIRTLNLSPNDGATNPVRRTSTRTWTYHGEGEDECAVNTITAVEGDTKSDFGGDYAGSIAQIAKDQEREVDDCDDVPEDEDLTELTYDWYLQDDFGNIWYMGEASRSFEDGCPSLDDLPDGNDWETGL